MLDLVLSEKNRILPLLANAYALLMDTPEWRGVLAWDRVRGGVVAIGEAPMRNAPRPGHRWERHHIARLCIWLQTHGVLVNYRQTAQLVDLIAHEVEVDIAATNDAWLPLVEQLTRGRMRVLSRSLIVELTGKPSEWITYDDERRLAGCLTELGFVRKRGTTTDGSRFWHYVREPVPAITVTTAPARAELAENPSYSVSDKNDEA